ncbi:M20 aminoacylase family protein [Azospirillum rugosum]|uniref:Hippurate hydrolase n=1 Tax=Azospirillum rugosum TaxID=416170 RepID=A0ABS4SF61_9PROT|nr:M20 aminoacylase family protein [Azospirillum rugosum]MBP2291213.1 hippurate hydrolase [Azospirillum rugosum]MDQ0524723.1 hippurate hydrolase [Azospirillum rugosum]
MTVPSNVRLDPAAEALAPTMREWRHHLHAHPETAFEEHETSAFVAEKLRSFGLEVTTGLGRTGVVGTLKGRHDGNRAIALRADMDALHMQEQNDFAHRSVNHGRMHACGHDGHTAMLLGAAKVLADDPDFHGTLHVIFQPAEENEGGAREMVADGLFDRFPVDSVYGMHNWPGLPLGYMALRPGPMMGSYDIFEIVVHGKGSHAAMPHLGADPITAVGHLLTTLQTIPGRSLHPLDSAVVSTTQIFGGDTWNVIPPSVTIRGTVRAFKASVQDTVEARMRTLAEHTTASFGCTAEVRYERRYPATVNSAAETALCAGVAARLVGAENVDHDPMPSMGAEDFAFMLEKRPGCYVWLGNGPAEGGCTLHNPAYDFNDANLAIGASYWVTLARTLLSPDAAKAA